MEQAKPKSAGIDRPFQSYKLIIDPCLVKGSTAKVYRFDGVVHDDPTYPPVVVRDPRNQNFLSRFWKQEPVELHMPKFKIDANYCGIPPPLQVTITNINDNVDKAFLSDLLFKYGTFEEIQIFFHPVTKKHLGMAHVLFCTKRGATFCVNRLNNTSVMGQVLNVFLDPFGKICKAAYEELTTDQKKESEKKTKPEVEEKLISNRTTVRSEQLSTKYPSTHSHKTKSLNVRHVEPPPVPEQRHSSTSTLKIAEQQPDCVKSPKMDLDTRIKMLLKGENANEFGRLLGVCSVDGDDTESTSMERLKLSFNKNDIWNPESDDDDSVESLFARKFKRNSFVPVESDRNFSPPPSPFLTSSETVTQHTNGLKLCNFDLDEVSDDSDSLSPTGGMKNVYEGADSTIILQPSEPPLPCESVPEIPPVPIYPPPQPQNYFPSAPSAYLQSSVNHPIPFNHYNSAYNNWNADNYVYPNYYDTSTNFGIPPPLPPDEEEPKESNEKELSQDEIIQAVVERLFTELKVTVRRDFQRKLIEHYAFKVFETWWTKHEMQHKEIQASERLKKLQPVGIGEWTAQSNKSIISGLGFRATIPKLPSFRKKRSSPTRAFDDDQKSDYSDNEDLNRSFTEIASSRRRRLSLSSESSSSSFAASSVLSDDTDTSSSDAEVEPVSKKDDFKAEALSDVSNSTLTEDEVKDASVGVDTVIRKEISSPIEVAKSEKEILLPHEVCQELPALPNEVYEDISEGPAKADETILAQDHNYAKGREEDIKPSNDFMNYVCQYLKDRTDEEAEKKVKQERENKTKHEEEKKVVPDIWFPVRSEDERREQVTEFLKEGVDEEDIGFLKTCFEMMVVDDTQGWLKKVHWVKHPATKADYKFKSDSRVHTTGSCRTEGYYKLSPEEKQKQKRHWFVKASETKTIQTTTFPSRKKKSIIPNDPPLSKTQLMCREARSNQRRLLTEFGTNESDLLKFNQLQFRKKALRFARSRIHDWGLFAAEPIAADEMVIEYVGQMVRNSVADWREKIYENVGIMSSYLFKIDGEIIVDATKCGNLSRFINHSCTPNCYAKIISIEGEKKIVIYSKQQIAVDEEITYDYKFPFEDAKIKCLCETYNCRGFLN